MSTDYYKELTLNELPTGFGLYTGVQVINKSFQGVTYDAKLSSTDLGLTETQINNDITFLEDTIYLSSEKTPQGNLSEGQISLDPAETGYFYILHKAFNNFKPTATATAGNETAKLTIESTSHLGDSDLDIEIFITGKRVVDLDVDPKRVKNFIAEKSYANSLYSLDFSWTCEEPNSYVTGFRLHLASNSDFSTPIFDSPYEIPVGTNSSNLQPLYGSYVGLSGMEFSKKIDFNPAQASAQPAMYAKLVPVSPFDDEGATDPITYTYGIEDGFSSNDFNQEVVDGSFAQPGSDLKFVPGHLILEKDVYGGIEDFDLMQFLYESNNNSYDFSFYSGVTVRFFDSSNNQGFIKASTADKRAITFNYRDYFYYSVNSDDNNTFRLNLEFDNVKVLGANGEGATVNRMMPSHSSDQQNDISTTPPQDGGDLFEFDNFDTSNLKFHYYILKDTKSIFYSGRGGTRVRKITNSERVRTYINGSKLRFDDFNSKKFITDADFSESESNDDGTDVAIGNKSSIGGLNFSSTTKFPNIYLGFKDRSIFDERNFLFRFTTKDITANAGTTTNQWSPVVDKALLNTNTILKTSDSANVLTVREAYGKKFYELARAGTKENSDNQIKAIRTSSLTTGETEDKTKMGPAYAANLDKQHFTILVFALATEHASNLFKMFDRDGASDVHKFITNTTYNFPYSNPPIGIQEPNSRIYNFSLNNDGKILSIFTGSSLNDVQYRVDPNNLSFQASNPPFLATDPSEQSIKAWSSSGGVEFANADPALAKQILLAKNLSSTVSNPGNFSVTNGSESATNYGSFCMFFVKMLSTKTNVAGIGPSSSFVVERTIINNQETSLNGWYFTDKFFENKNKRIQLHNGSYNNDVNTRLFLFDYMYGIADTVTERNDKCDEIIEYLSDYYQPLLLKSQSDLLIGQHSGGQNTSINFGLPLGHPYLNINYKNV